MFCFHFHCLTTRSPNTWRKLPNTLWWPDKLPSQSYRARGLVTPEKKKTTTQVSSAQKTFSRWHSQFTLLSISCDIVFSMIRSLGFISFICHSSPVFHSKNSAAGITSSVGLVSINAKTFRTRTKIIHWWYKFPIPIFKTVSDTVPVINEFNLNRPKIFRRKKDKYVWCDWVPNSLLSDW